jgi:hypothetical protein
MRALRGMVVGVFALLTGCVAYGPQPAGYGYGYGYGSSYSYSPVYVAPAPRVVVPVVRYPQRYPGHRHWGHRRWRG